MLENHLREGLPVLGPTCLLSDLVFPLIQTKVPVVFGLGFLNLVTYIIHILFVDSYYMRPFPEIFAFIRVCIIRPPQISVNRISCHVSFRPSFFWLFSMLVCTDYGRPMKPFFIEIPNVWAWADKLWGIWGIFGQTISTHFGTVTLLSKFSIIQPLFEFLQKKPQPLYLYSKYLF